MSWDIKMKRRIVIVGTKARGGVSSVIDSYNNADFYSQNQTIFLPSHQEGGVLLRLSIALYALANLLFY